MARRIYVVGSLRNPRCQEVATGLREAGHEVFDDWQAAGPEADDYWQKYEQSRGKTYLEALHSPAAQNVFDFDMRWLEWCDTGVLVLPSGRSAHMELGRLEGRGKDVHILLEGEPERWDVMYKLATCHYDIRTILEALSD